MEIHVRAAVLPAYPVAPKALTFGLGMNPAAKKRTAATFVVATTPLSAAPPG